VVDRLSEETRIRVARVKAVRETDLMPFQMHRLGALAPDLIRADASRSGRSDPPHEQARRSVQNLLLPRPLKVHDVHAMCSAGRLLAGHSWNMSDAQLARVVQQT